MIEGKEESLKPADRSKPTKKQDTPIFELPDSDLGIFYVYGVPDYTNFGRKSSPCRFWSRNSRRGKDPAAICSHSACLRTHIRLYCIQARINAAYNFRLCNK